MKMLSEQLDSALSWSMIADTPVPIYVEQYDANLVYWNGVAMTRSYALLIIATTWMNMYHSDCVKEEAWAEYNRLYRLGAFGHRDWDEKIANISHHNMIGYLTNLIAKNGDVLAKLKERTSPAEAIDWLHPSSVRIVGERNDEV